LWTPDDPAPTLKENKGENIMGIKQLTKAAYSGYVTVAFSKRSDIAEIIERTANDFNILSTDDEYTLACLLQSVAHDVDLENREHEIAADAAQDEYFQEVAYGR
jgi:hypothetical protein